jgi:hypothetical protein
MVEEMEGVVTGEEVVNTEAEVLNSMWSVHTIAAFTNNQNSHQGQLCSSRQGRHSV